MGLSGISRLFLGYKKEPKRGNEGCFRVFNGDLELPYVNISYISSHSNHVNHPFKGMVHLIYKFYLKAVFLCVKFNGAIDFSEKCLFFYVKHVLNSKKKAPDNPKTGA